MSARFPITSTSQSGWIDISFKRQTRHVGSWMLRIIKQADDKSELYMTISVWPRDRKFDKVFVTSLQHLGKDLDVQDFKTKAARMLDQEYEITCTIPTASKETVIMNLMTRLCRMRLFSRLMPVLETDAAIYYTTGQ